MTKKRGKLVKNGLSLLLVLVMMITAMPLAQVSVEAAYLDEDCAVASSSPNRDKVVQYMRDMATIKWTAGANFSTLWNGKTGSRVYWKKGVTYYGIPYSQQYTYKYTDSGKINLGQFKDILEKNNGKISSEIGRNDCSNTVCSAWRHIDKNVNGDSTAGLTPGKGQIVAVGKYTYYNSGDSPKLTTCQKNGSKTMYAAYDCLQAGDAVCKNGHIMMVVSVNKSKQTVKVIHQSGSEKHYDPNKKKTTSGAKNSSWGVEENRNYSTLFKEGYIPITCKALAKESAVKYTITANPVTESKTTNNSAEFNVGISPEAKVEKIGVFFGKNKDDIKAITTSTKHEKTSKHNYYLLAEWANGKSKSSYSFDKEKKTTKNGWTIKFDKGKTYHYKFVVVNKQPKTFKSCFCDVKNIFAVC